MQWFTPDWRQFEPVLADCKPPCTCHIRVATHYRDFPFLPQVAARLRLCFWCDAEANVALQAMAACLTLEPGWWASTPTATMTSPSRHRSAAIAPPASSRPPATLSNSHERLLLCGRPKPVRVLSAVSAVRPPRHATTDARSLVEVVVYARRCARYTLSWILNGSEAFCWAAFTLTCPREFWLDSTFA